MEGYKVVTMEYAADKADIFVTATGNKSVIGRKHIEAMKNEISFVILAILTMRLT